MKNVCKKVLVVLMAAIMLVTMLPSSEAMAADVRLEQSNVSIVVGETSQLTVTGTKSKVTWTSSDKKIATVSSKGKVKGIKVGKATITAKVSGKKYTADVEVKKQLVAELAFKAPKGGKITTKKIDGKTVYILPYGSTFTLEKTNGSTIGGLAQSYSADFQEYKKKVGSIKGIGVEPGYLEKGVTYTLNEEDAFKWLGVFVYRKKDEKKYIWEDGWRFEMNEGRVNLKKLPEYDYFTMTIYDQSGTQGVGGQVEYYFRFK